VYANGDCLDSDGTVNPRTTRYKDADGDNYSDGTTQKSCTDPGADWKLAGELNSMDVDCNDDGAGASVMYPGNTEVCDNYDNNCAGGIDENLTENATNQNGLCAGNTKTCTAGVWNDNNEYTAVAEICDGDDNDCDGSTDEGLTAPAANLQEGVCNGSVKVCNGA